MEGANSLSRYQLGGRQTAIYTDRNTTRRQGQDSGEDDKEEGNAGLLGLSGHVDRKTATTITLIGTAAR